MRGPGEDALRSWLAVEPDPDALRLPPDLAARDPFAARDIGWVGAMRPFVRDCCPPGGRVLDPFCGFATTLVAAVREGRAAAGTEIDPARAALARERLQRLGLAADVHTGSVAALPAGARFDLVLTSVPYFGCGWPGAALAGQLYLADDYAAWLHGLRDVFHALRPHVADGGSIVAMCENVVVGGRRYPQAFDLARILGSLYEAQDERVLCYPPRPRPAVAGDPLGTDRSHEHALVFRNVRRPTDPAATAAVLADIRAAGFVVDVHGSWADDGRDPRAPPPNDLDLRLPRDEAALARLLAFLRDRGFRFTLWGEPPAAPPDLATLDRYRYLRAEREGRDGGTVRIDLMTD